MRRKRLFLGVLLVLFLMPINNVFASTQDFYFKDFTADYYLTKSEDGTSKLHVKEILTAVFPNFDQNHGITRSIPFTNQGGENETIANVAAMNLTVLRNGRSEEINKIEVEDGYYVAYIGSANGYVHGEQVYTLEYDFTDVITEFDENGNNVSGKEDIEESFQELYWNTNGTEWLQRFDKVTANLHIPADIYEKMDKKAWCYVGMYGEKGEDRCEITLMDDGFSFTTENLAVGENLTFVTQFKPDTFKVIIRKDYTLILMLIGEIVLVVIIMIWLRLRWLKEAKSKHDFYKKIFVTPQYQPPKDQNVCVAEGEQIYFKKTKSSYVATLLELAVNKKVVMEKVGDKKYDWAVTLVVDPDELTGPQKQMMNILSGDGKFEKGVKMPIKKHEFTQYLSDCAKSYEGDATKALEKGGYFSKKGVLKANRMMVKIVAFVVVMMFGGIAVLIAGMGGKQRGKGFIVLLILLILQVVAIIASWVILRIYKYAQCTEKGLELVRYLEGLELYIKMAETDRLKFLQSVEGVDISNAGIVKLYEKLLPWASLFGMEKSWARELEKYYKIEDIDSTISIDVLNGIATSSIMHDIDRTVMSSTGSSGSGGGGSSGGGGGGGGGGGW